MVVIVGMMKPVGSQEVDIWSWSGTVEYMAQLQGGFSSVFFQLGPPFCSHLRKCCSSFLVFTMIISLMLYLFLFHCEQLNSLRPLDVTTLAKEAVFLFLFIETGGSFDRGCQVVFTGHKKTRAAEEKKIDQTLYLHQSTHEAHIEKSIHNKDEKRMKPLTFGTKL